MRVVAAVVQENGGDASLSVYCRVSQLHNASSYLNFQPSPCGPCGPWSPAPSSLACVKIGADNGA